MYDITYNLPDLLLNLVHILLHIHYNYMEMFSLQNVDVVQKNFQYFH